MKTKYQSICIHPNIVEKIKKNICQKLKVKLEIWRRMFIFELKNTSFALSCKLRLRQLY